MIKLKSTRSKIKYLLLGIVFFVLVSVFIVIFLLGNNDSRYLPENAELTILQLTDLHLSSGGGVRDTSWSHRIIVNGYKLHKPCTGKSLELLEKAVKAINEKIKPDIVVITGDIVNRGDDVEAMKKGHDILADLKCPLIILKGDHDIAKISGNEHIFETVFGKSDGALSVKGFPFFYIPYDADDNTLERLQRSIESSSSDKKVNFLCMHRMLYASWLMKKLSKKYCQTLLSPKRKNIIAMLEKSRGKWIVLCGHSHTNYEKSVNNLTELCTSSLAEYPHEFRIVKIKNGKLYTRIMKLDKKELD